MPDDRLVNLANATLRRAYDAAPQTFAPIPGRVKLPDFKATAASQFLNPSPLFFIVAEPDSRTLPPGSRASWKRGIWA